MNASPTLDRAAPTYDALAPHYDAYTDFPIYRNWITGLEELARRHGVRGRRLLDAGCGTGKSFLPLLERGYEVTGADGSTGMLACAEAKVGDRVRLVHTDLVDLPDLGPFDLITCLNDVANCIVDPHDLARVLERFAANLAADGVLVFDASLISAYRTIFATTHQRERPGSVFVWIGETDPELPEGGIATARHDMFIEDDDGRWQRLWCRHVQRHHPHEEIAAALDGAGLEIVALLGDDDGKRDGTAPDPARHLKAIYVVRRRAEA
ncbi:MAG TPA: class I SAM-dependent methyltransferase [Capillimicrobium sp.]|nr:class I SAM-dependent methyltransferase [Capillimicrobium sp.]